MSAVLAVFVPLVIAYGGTLVWLWQSWTREGSFWSYGPLVPLVIATVIYMRRAHWRAEPARHDARAWLLLGPALLLHVAGAALTIDSLSGASIALAVPGAAWLALGARRMRSLWSALWFVAFAIPLPIFVSGRIVFELKELVVSAAIALGNLLGVGLARVGAEIQVAGQRETLVVADPCSGLNSLLAMLTLGYCVAFFLGDAGTARRTLVLVAAVPIAVFVNVLRVTGLCVLAGTVGTPWASTTGHTILNGAEWVVALALLFGTDWLLGRIARRGGA